MTRTVNRLSVRTVRNDVIKESARIAAGAGLPWDDIKWTVSRYEGHLDGWQIVSHNRPGPKVRNG